jgi:hypothetical protein
MTCRDRKGIGTKKTAFGKTPSLCSFHKRQGLTIKKTAQMEIFAEGDIIKKTPLSK